MHRLIILVLMCATGQIFSKSIQNTTSSDEELMEKRMELIENKIASLENERKTKPVLFYAIVNGRQFTLNTDSTIVFETVVINEGDHYNKNDGVFVAPQDGIYMFSWTVSTIDANWLMTELLVEDTVISSTGVRDVDSGSRSSASMTAFCRMKKDEHAFVRTTGSSGSNFIYSYDNQPRTSFLGIMINVD
ncbi:heavy metal-binding protein HIP-like [Mytilus trossulus]|uniref:heavy metal-binding protein HIP-like n=1 Tax=Mytilus trossulus TaxID=6551 RepID=UPI00300789C6